MYFLRFAFLFWGGGTFVKTWLFLPGKRNERLPLAPLAYPRERDQLLPLHRCQVGEVLLDFDFFVKKNICGQYVHETREFGKKLVRKMTPHAHTLTSTKRWKK